MTPEAVGRDARLQVAAVAELLAVGVAAFARGDSLRLGAGDLIGPAFAHDSIAVFRQPAPR